MAKSDKRVKITLECTECKERGAEEECGGKARYSGTLAARDLLRTDVACAGYVLKLHG